jgi:multidrug efflux pump subunit AcrB
MSLSSFSIKSPYTISALALLVVSLGIFSFYQTPTDLFPNTIPPQVTVITVWPGAVSNDIADKITRIIENELNTISGLKRITSISRDEVSSINAEFHYDKDLDEAVVDVQNLIGRIIATLPKTIQAPRIYRISDATKPLITLALSPKPKSSKTLSEIRLLAENKIEDRLLNIDGVAEIDVFGANKLEVKVLVDRLKLSANHLNLSKVITALSSTNISAPAGTIYALKKEFIIKVSGEYRNLEEIRNTPIVFCENGLLRLKDIAEVRLSVSEQRSAYHGNGKPAIAINILKPENGPTVKTIHNIKNELPRLAADYPDIEFVITDDQQPLINLNVNGMRSSLLQAVILTVAVVLLFLADFRAAIIVSISIPIAFLSSFIVVWFSPYTLNMVTLTALIISVGMVVDASIVVLENIYRHYHNEIIKNATLAAERGAKEVSLAVFAGLLTTVIVLIPVMFAGGYSQQTLRPLSIMVSATLVASLLAALTIVPLLCSRLLAHGKHKRNFIERILAISDYAVNLFGKAYLIVLQGALKIRIIVILLAAVFLVFTLTKVRPLLGGEVMPKMDTGIVNLEFKTPSDFPPKQVEKILTEIEKVIYSEKSVLSVSAKTGSEPGEVSFGGGGATAQSGRIRIRLTNRKKRVDTIWQIQDRWRKKLKSIPGIQSFRISEYGATPVSTTKAPLDIIISGPDPLVLNEFASDVMLKLNGIPGLVDVRRSWYIDKRDCQVRIDPALAALYNISPVTVAEELKTAIKGSTATNMRLNGYLDLPVKVQYKEDFIQHPWQLRALYINTEKGQVPLRSLATIKPHRNQPFISRENLMPTIDVTGVNRNSTIAQITKRTKQKMKGIKLPPGYNIKIAGSAVDMATGRREMGRALIVGIALLFILLVIMFKSFLHPFTIMVAIPLAAAGGFWGLLIFNKPMCKPAMMGMILLGGTIVNNSILLLDFIINAREQGLSRDNAIIQSVKLRLRPILMTTVSTIIALLPLIFEMAVGLERMSPLGIVAASGMLVGTVLTMIVVPVFYSIFDSLSSLGLKAFHWFIKSNV